MQKENRTPVARDHNLNSQKRAWMWNKNLERDVTNLSDMQVDKKTDTK